MTEFLLQSTIVMVVLLSMYQLFLEKEKMHRFNRFYLLGSLIFALTLPLITIKVYHEIESPVTQVIQEPLVEQMAIPTQNTPMVSVKTIEEQPLDYTPYVLWTIYGFTACGFAFRFIKNILHLSGQIKSSTAITIDKASIVLTDRVIQPFTFLNYIFINRQDYKKKSVENEVLAHEMAHVKQKHTLDILFIELLKIILWFNPMLYYYKKCIQLNHEFLADESVIAQNNNIIGYQQLLVKRLTPVVKQQIASCLNFKLTEKRLLMMSKSTSKTKALAVKLLILPIATGLIYLIAIKSVAQVQHQPEQKTNSVAKNQELTEEDKTRDRYYEGVRLVLKNSRREILIDKPYEKLSLEEKRAYLFIVPKPNTIKPPTEQQFNDYKNKMKYALWIDGKNVDNSILNNYKATDFALVTGSSVFKNARTKKHPQPFQYNLYTQSYFDKNLKNSHLKYSSDKAEIILPKETRTKEEFELESHRKVTHAKTAKDSIKKVNYTPDPDDYYAGVRFIYYKTAYQTKDSMIGKDPYFDKVYEDITADEKKAESWMFLTPSPQKPVPPTLKEMSLGKNSKNCSVWIDGKNVANSELNKYKPSDFANFASTVILKNGRTKQHPQPYRYMFDTHAYYNINELDKVPARYGDSEKMLFKKLIKV